MVTTKLLKGRVIKVISNHYQVLLENNEIVDARVKGKVRLQSSIVGGDFVELEYVYEKYMIDRILPRTNFLIRPPIANVDQAIIVMSIVEPDFSPKLVDQLLFLVEYMDINPIILVTKCDKEYAPSLMDLVDDYVKSGYKVIKTGKGDLLDKLIGVFDGKVSVLAGQSGVGKSTVLNRINNEFNLETQAISKALGRGKHTTRHVQLFPVNSGWVADTPGFSKLDFTNLDKERLRDSIFDFKGHGPCQFRDCMHVNEPNCEIKRLVNEKVVSSIRYNNYLEVLKLIDDKRR